MLHGSGQVRRWRSVGRLVAASISTGRASRLAVATVLLCLLSIVVGHSHSAAADTGNASFISTALSRGPDGTLSLDVVIRISNVSGPGQVCSGGNPRCVVFVEGRFASGTTGRLVTREFSANDDLVTLTVNEQGIRASQVVALRIIVSGGSGDLDSAWSDVTDPYPVTATVIGPSSTFVRTGNGDAEWVVAAQASGFNEPDHVCAYSTRYAYLKVLHENGSAELIDVATITLSAPYPAHLTFTGSDSLDKVVGWRVDLAGNRETYTGPVSSLTDPLPDVATSLKVNQLWRTGDNRLGWNVDATAAGIWQRNRPCWGVTFTSAFRCVVTLEGRQVESGEGVELDVEPVVLDASYPIVTNISGQTPGRSGEYSAFRIRVGKEGTSIGFVGPWVLVSDVSFGELRGGSNAAVNVCPCGYADPVDAYLGSFSQGWSDVALPGVGPVVGVVRSYSSSAAGSVGAFGFGWTSNVESGLSFPSSEVVVVGQENGAEVRFVRSADGSFAASARVIATLVYDSVSLTYTYVRRGVERLRFDGAGRLLSVADSSGNTVAVGRDGSGRVSVLTGSGGRVVTLVWTGSRVSRVTDSAGRSVEYGYSAGGDLMSVRAVDGGVTAFTYDSAHRMLTVTKPSGGVVTNTYHPDGRVADQTDPVGRTTSFRYEAGVTTVTEPSGTKIAETYVGGLLVRRVVRVAGVAPRTTLFTYDDANNLLSTVDAAGKTTRATYDGRGNVLTRTDALGKVSRFTYNALNQVLTSTDPLNRKTTATYTATGQQVTGVDPAGKTTTWTFNADGTVKSSTDPLGKVTTFTYDPAGRPAGSTDPDGRVRSVGYSPAGFVTSETDPGGKVTTTTRDPAGRPVTVRDADGNVTTNVYDGSGNLTRVTDPRGHDATAVFDGADQRTSATDANGYTTAWTYAPDGQVKTVTGPRGGVTTNVYDGFGQLTSVTDPGNRVTRYTYDAVGRVVTVTAPTGAVSKTSYDAAGQMLTTTDPLGKVTKYAYDAAGQQTSSTDPLNRVTKQAYSTTGLPTVTTLPGTPAITETTAYDAAGRQTSFTNADGLVTSYIWGPGGLLTSKTEPGTMTTSYTYDAAGRQRTVTTPDGHVTTTSYSDAGRPTRIHSDTAGSTDVTYTWDANGNRATMTDATGTTRYSYDNGDRLTATTNGAGTALAYGYNATDDVTTITYPGAKTVTYGYDSASRMTSVKDWANRTSTFTWTVNGQLSSQGYANGLTETRTYDTAGRLKQVKHANPAGTALATYGYTYDAAGQLTADSSNDPLGASIARTYTYDTTSQLVSVAGSGTTGAATATPGGQLTKIPTTGTTTSSTLTYNTKQQVTSLTPATGTPTSYSYDGNGSRTTATTGSSTTTTSWTAFGDLATATLPGKTIAYSSDGDHLRQTRTSAGVTKQFLWDTNNALPLLLDDGTQTYLYGPLSTPIAQIDAGGTIQYLHTDLLGSARLITTATGTIAAARAYTAHGTPTTGSGTATTAIGYTGNWTDPDTGLLYLRARDYDPTTSQFLTTDPAVEATRQPYTYTSNNPLLETDPTGLCGTTPTPHIQCAELSLGDKILTSAPATWLADVLTKGPTGEASNFVQGIGNGATFGLTGTLRQALTPNYACIADQSAFFHTGTITGAVAVTAVPGAGAISAAGRAARAGDLATDAARASTYIYDVVRANSTPGFVTTSRGVTYDIPSGYSGRLADNGQGLVYQKPGSAGNANSIRIMGPNAQNPKGYSRYTNDIGQPLNPNTGKPLGTSKELHVPSDREGRYKGWPK